MSAPSSHEVTQLLAAWGDGDEAAFAQLVPIIHAELYRLAKYYLKRERAGHTLRRILVDFARRRPRPQGEAAQHVALDEALLVAAEPDADVVALDEALDALAQHDPRKARLVELRDNGTISLMACRTSCVAAPPGAA